MDNKTIYSFLGLPACGKGTQIALFAEKINAEKSIGIGELVREIIAKDSDDPFEKEIKDRYDKGIPQPDSVAEDLMARHLLHIKENAILDNFPFTISQSKFIENFIAKNPEHWHRNVAIHIKVDPEVVIKRATKRKICPDCKSVYGYTDETACPKCGASLITRADDNEEVMRTRVGRYEPNIKEVVGYFKANNLPLIEVNGELSPEEVAAEIDEKIAALA